MASNLLQCLICPKGPNFSDASHLLTHISSKGHLAHLHKLQVRSHQEIAAGHQLALYNQWFQQHGVAQLLSERLSQKETKRATKTAAIQRRGATVVPANIKQDSDDEDSKNLFLIPTHPAVRTNATTRRRVIRRRRVSNQESPYTPVPRSRRRKQNELTPTPRARIPSASRLVDTPGNDNLELSPWVRSSPQLKGTVWPGMAMFDAAPEEMKRKRNQKKDASVLRSIQKAASEVEPLELVHSADGIVLKERHMDDLENDSLVEGESELMRPSPKKRRIYSSRTSGNARRPTVRKRVDAKNGTRKVKIERRTPVQNTVYTEDQKPSSSVEGLPLLPAYLSPTADRAIDFKPAARNRNKPRKARRLAIYEDTSSSVDNDGSTEHIANPFLEMPTLDSSQVSSQLAYQPAYWFGNQARSSELSDPFKALRQSLPGGGLNFLVSPDKENDIKAVNRLNPNDGGGHINPLFLNERSLPDEDSKPCPFGGHGLGGSEHRTPSSGRFQTQFDRFSSATATALSQMHHNPLSAYDFSPFNLVNGQFDTPRYRPALFAP